MESKTQVFRINNGNSTGPFANFKEFTSPPGGWQKRIEDLKLCTDPTEVDDFFAKRLQAAHRQAKRSLFGGTKQELKEKVADLVKDMGKKAVKATFIFAIVAVLSMLPIPALAALGVLVIGKAGFIAYVKTVVTHFLEEELFWKTLDETLEIHEKLNILFIELANWSLKSKATSKTSKVPCLHDSKFWDAVFSFCSFKNKVTVETGSPKKKVTYSRGATQKESAREIVENIVELKTGVSGRTKNCSLNLKNANRRRKEVNKIMEDIKESEDSLEALRTMRAYYLMTRLRRNQIQRVCVAMRRHADGKDLSSMSKAMQKSRFLSKLVRKPLDAKAKEAIQRQVEGCDVRQRRDLTLSQLNTCLKQALFYFLQLKKVSRMENLGKRSLEELEELTWKKQPGVLKEAEGAMTSFVKHTVWGKAKSTAFQNLLKTVN